jgi:hypothetical protein
VIAGRLSPRARLLLAVALWLVATLLVVTAFRALGGRAALDAVRAARGPWLVVAVAAHSAVIALWAWQTRLLLPRARRAPYARLLEVQALSAAAANTIPAFLGAATGVALLGEVGGVGMAAALGVYAQHNVAEGVAKLVTLAAAARVAPLPPWMLRAVTALAAGLVVLVAALALGVWLVRRRPPPVDAGTADDRRARLHRFATTWAASLDALRTPRFALAIVIGVAMKAAEAGGWWAVERALDVAPRTGAPCSPSPPPTSPRRCRCRPGTSACTRARRTASTTGCSACRARRRWRSPSWGTRRTSPRSWGSGGRGSPCASCARSRGPEARRPAERHGGR